ncbi:MAG TPA: hypothetical protein DDX39_12005 [Bacteroidales bacterium]|nr:MAG: hypothetical protein A2W98_10380 [Bacteroidetes bacterium GWF2_33_38]HBF89355.1 hypothetical protein [Bacteroidales bacterium]
MKIKLPFLIQYFMKKSLVILILFFTIVNISKSQYAFHRLVDYNNQVNGGWSIIQTSDSGYISSGIIYGDYYAILFVKIDLKGDTTWTKMYDWYQGYGEDGYSIIQLPNNYYSVCGDIPDTVNIDTDTFLFTLNENGDSVTFKTIEGGVSDHGFMHKQTSDGGFIIGGINLDATQTYSNVFLIKTDSLGNIQWQREYGAANYNDNLKSIDLTADGGFIIGGDYYNPSTSSNDMFLLKTDSLGNQEWKKSFGTTAEEYRGFTIATSDKGYIIVGDKKMTDNYYNGYIVKTDSSGNQQWSKTFGATGLNEYFKIVRQLSDGSYIVAGGKADLSGTPNGRRVWLLKFNMQGDTLWSKSFNYYGGTKQTYVEDLNLTNDGGFIATGYIINNSLPAKNDLWLLKTDSMGNTCTIDTTTYEGCWSYSCYTVNSEITADSDTVYLTEGATVQFGIISNFGTNWQWDFGDTITSTEQFPQHSYTHTGIKTVQLITNNDYCSDTAYYTITVFLDVSTKEITNYDLRFTIYPNPASEQLTIISNQYPANDNRTLSVVEVYDLFGKEVLTTELKTEKQLIDISALKQGIYYYKIVNNGELTDGGKLVIVR